MLLIFGGRLWVFLKNLKKSCPLILQETLVEGMCNKANNLQKHQMQKQCLLFLPHWIALLLLFSKWQFLCAWFNFLKQCPVCEVCEPWDLKTHYDYLFGLAQPGGLPNSWIALKILTVYSRIFIFWLEHSYIYFDGNHLVHVLSALTFLFEYLFNFQWSLYKCFFLYLQFWQCMLTCPQ